LHRALGGLERELAQSEDKAQLTQHQARLSEIESAVRTLKIAPSPSRRRIDTSSPPQNLEAILTRVWSNARKSKVGAADHLEHVEGLTKV